MRVVHCQIQNRSRKMPEHLNARTPQHPPPTVAVILVNYKGKADTLECLDSLRQDDYPNKRVLVVDNGSNDDSAAVIRQRFPEVEVLETGANLGFGGGNNVGIRRALDAGADYVFLLNNDTTVEPDALTALVQAAEATPRYGLLTPLILYYDHPEDAWFAGSWLDLRYGKVGHQNEPIPNRDAAPIPLPWATGCAMLIQAEVIRAIEGFDERYFLYWEDVDLSLRIRELGHELALVPQARIYHKVSRSVGLTSRSAVYYMVRNNLLLQSRHGKSRRIRGLKHIVVWRLQKGLSGLLRREESDARLFVPTLCGVRDYLLGRYGPWRATPGR